VVLGNRGPEPGIAGVEADHPPLPGGVGRLTTAVEQAAGTVTAVDVVESHPDRMVVDLTCNARETDHAEQLAKAVGRLDGVETREVGDRNLSFLRSTALSPDEAVLGSEQPPAHEPLVSGRAHELEGHPHLG
jgi:hypothetical protein